MKRHIFILSSLLCVYGINHAVASDYFDDAKPNTTETIVKDSKYATQQMDDPVKVRPCDDGLKKASKANKDFWTADPLATNTPSIQMVKVSPSCPNNEKPCYKKRAVSDTENKIYISEPKMTEQAYYNEPLYIVNNFLSQEEIDVYDMPVTEEKLVDAVDNLTGTWDEVTKTSSTYFASNLSKSGCPFDNDSDCAIWARKPIVSEIVAPRSKKLSAAVMANISAEVATNSNISANEEVMLPLLNRYRVLMRASQSCCTGGIVHKMKKSGAKQKLIYKSLSDDANFSGFTSRCMVMNDEDIAEADKYDITSATVADVRNTCLCKSKKSLEALLAPFDQLYKDYPRFADAPFEYQHFDGVGRAVTDSVNADVQNVLFQLEMCP